MPSSTTMPAGPLDAIVVVSFGGPEGPDEVIPFLEQVLAGRGVGRARLEAVAEHYHLFGGVSPINAQNRALVDALSAELATHGSPLPVYLGNRNWHPFLADTVQRMADDGVRRAAGFVTSAYPSWSGCRQYRNDIARASAAVGPAAPQIDKLRLFFDHPGFVGPLAEALMTARHEAGLDAPVLFSAHSIPQVMADTSDYVAALMETAQLVARRSGSPSPTWQLVFQSRSGPPNQPWLEPDVNDVVTALSGQTDAVIIAPIGFVSDHMEVVYDLDTQAADAARRAGLALVRASTPGTHPEFVAMIAELVNELVDPAAPKRALRPRSAGAPRGGVRHAGHCGDGCCPAMPPGPPGADNRAQ
ncbi:MAG: ferrochelatase [Actinomycetota bacterium]|nr:ferrochelatase [Actinomycetota bacterium]